jgi:MFS family permease
MTPSNGIPNTNRLFFGSFLILVVAGMAFSARGAVLATWGADFGFTQSELGVITGFGLTGFGLTVMAFSVLTERLGYGVLIALTFAFHAASGLVTLAAVPVFHVLGKPGVFWCLSIGTALLAVGNGASEAAINPLVAVLHPRERTHRLNILHAGYPGGLVVGAGLCVLLKGVRWEIILLTYLAPTILYGWLMFRQKFPASQARRHNLPMATMLKEFTSPVLLFLLFLMALVGFVELGTDSWIQNITGILMGSRTKGQYLFIGTSALMFALRFVAGPIVHRISPLGLLLASACLGALGLLLLSAAGASFDLISPMFAASVAAAVYGMGKSFYWPTMLGVVAERFPRGGAYTLGALGCVATLSAGLLGGPAIGFMQDYFASQDLQAKAPSAYERYRAEKENTLLWIFHVRGLDGSKVAVLDDNGGQLAKDWSLVEASTKPEKKAYLAALHDWWQSAQAEAAADRGPITDATLRGGRMAFRLTALVPMTMALGYLLLILYFKARGGYRQIHLDEEPATPL